MSTKALGPLLLIATVACYSWNPQAPTPNAGASGTASGVMRATLVDGSRVEVYDGEITNDSLRGWDLRKLRIGSRVPIAVPRSQVRLVETRHVNAGKTRAVVLAIAIPLGICVSFAMSNGPI